MLFRDVHETLRPEFVDELAHAGTVYGTRVTAGALFSWPKDPDDLVFGAVQLGAAALVVMSCPRWRDS